MKKRLIIIFCLWLFVLDMASFFDIIKGKPLPYLEFFVGTVVVCLSLSLSFIFNNRRENAKS